MTTLYSHSRSLPLPAKQLHSIYRNPTNQTVEPYVAPTLHHPNQSPDAACDTIHIAHLIRRVFYSIPKARFRCYVTITSAGAGSAGNHTHASCAQKTHYHYVRMGKALNVIWVAAAVERAHHHPLRHPKRSASSKNPITTKRNPKDISKREDGVFTVVVTMHIFAERFSMCARYDTKENRRCLVWFLCVRKFRCWNPTNGRRVGVNGWWELGSLNVCTELLW